MKEKSKIREEELKLFENNENGVVLVLSLIVLVVISMLAVFAVSISNIEIQSSTNNEKFQTSFLLGEGVAVEGVGLLQNQTYNNLIQHTPDLYGGRYQDWLDEHGIYFSGGQGPDLTNPDNWDLTTHPDPPTAGGDRTSPTALSQGMDSGGLQPPGFDATAPTNDRLQFAVQDTGIAAGYDESAATQVRAYFLFGLYDVGRQAAFPGLNIIEMGYRMPLTAPESL